MKNRPSLRYFSGPFKAFLGIFLLVSVLLPLLRMFANIGSVDPLAIIAGPRFKQAVIHSLTASAAATVISVALAWVFALCTLRTGMRFREILGVFGTLPMLIPSISHGMGLVFLLGANGLLTRLFNLSGSIYGLKGIVLGSVFYAFPVAFLMFSDILKYQDCSPYEAAAVLGIPRRRQFFSITLPYLRRPLVSVVFAVFTLIITDYGVPLIVGGRYATLPTLMYQEVIGLLHFGEGSVIGAFLLIPAAAAFIFDLLSRDRQSQGFVIQQTLPRKNKFRDAAALGYCLAVCFLIALPIGGFCLLVFAAKYPVDMSFSLANIERTLQMKAGRYLLNSLLIASGTAVLGTGISYALAYWTARTKGRFLKALHLISITSLAIPGLVLGLSYVLFFKGSFFYGSFAILILVNIVHFMASPYLMAYNSLGKLNIHLEEVGQTLGVGRFFVIRDVIIPQTRITILEMLSYFFVNCMMTISAVSFLAASRNRPVALLITQFETQLFFEGAAFVSVLILACNLTVKILIYLYKRKENYRDQPKRREKQRAAA